MIKAKFNVFILRILTLLLWMSGSIYGQTAAIDSLKNVIEVGLRDTTQVNNLNALSVASIRNEDISGSLIVSRQAGVLADELRYLKGKAYAEKNIGMAYYYQGDYMEVLNYWTKSLETFEAIKDTLGIANLANNRCGIL